MSNSNLTATTPNTPGLDGAYQALARAEHGSPEAMAAIADIQRHELAAYKAQENVIKGTGISGHASGRYDVAPADAVTAYEHRDLGIMHGGNTQSSPDLRTGIVKIGDFTTSLAVGEAMRRDMSAAEWTALTNLPYQPLEMLAGATTPTAPGQYRPADPRLQAIDDALNNQNQLDALKEATDLEKAQADETALINYDASLLEQIVKQGYGPEVADSLTSEIVASGDMEAESLAQYGVTAEMMNDTVAYYQDAAEGMLLGVNSSVAFLSDFLSDPEAKSARQAIVARDMAKVISLGERARDRAAGMSYGEISNWLSRDEKASVRLRNQNGTAIIDIPGVGTTSWANAVTNGLISFNSKVKGK
jgi:hypothetical protein